MDIISGVQAYDAIKKSLGLEGKPVKRVVIVIDHEEALQIYVQMYGEKPLAADLAALFKVNNFAGYPFQQLIPREVKRVEVNDRAEVKVEELPPSA